MHKGTATLPRRPMTKPSITAVAVAPIISPMSSLLPSLQFMRLRLLQLSHWAIVLSVAVLQCCSAVRLPVEPSLYALHGMAPMACTPIPSTLQAVAAAAPSASPQGAITSQPAVSIPSAAITPEGAAGEDRGVG